MFTRLELTCIFREEESKEKIHDAIRKEFEKRKSKPPYSSGECIKKLQYINSEISRIRKENFLVYFLPIIVFFTTLTIIAPLVNESTGMIAFSMAILAGTGSFIFANKYLSVPDAILLQFYGRERNELESEVARLLDAAGRKAESIFNEMTKRPDRINSLFSQYTYNIGLEVVASSPYLRSQAKRSLEISCKKDDIISLLKPIATTSTAVPLDSSPSAKLICPLLKRERDRVKELAHSTKLSFEIIDWYSSLSRIYYGYKRPGGIPTVYDEQVLTNEIIAIKETLSVHGNYIEKSLTIDQSVNINNSINNTTKIEKAFVENTNYTPEKIKKEILRIILSSDKEDASRTELLAEIPVKESRLIQALEELQESGRIRISNRDTGEIIYVLDRLA